MTEEVRIDKWLWAVRLYKTRGLAAQACRGGKVKIDGLPAKPSRVVRVGDVYLVEKEGLTRRVKVIGLLENRVGAKAAVQYAEDQTPAAEYERLKERKQQPPALRRRGMGRPTKRDRRQLERLFE